MAKCYGRRLVLSVDLRISSSSSSASCQELTASFPAQDPTSNNALAAWAWTLFDASDVAGAELDSQLAASGTLPEGTIRNARGLMQWNIPFMHVDRMWAEGKDGHAAIVAVLDSGIAVSSLPMFEERVLDGYDFVSDPELAMDENGGRDPDALDPGDAHGEQCPSGSSWHGTFVSSVALAGKSTEFSGIAHEAKLLPVRVLGKCSMGYASDVADGIVWAAGGHINGLDDNPSPAQILVMSFSGPGACPSFVQTAVDLAAARNVTLFAAAGNNPMISAADSFPANCKGVVSVGAIDERRLPTSYTARNADVYMPGGTHAVSIPCVGASLVVEECIGTSMAVPHAAALFLLNEDRAESLRWFVKNDATGQSSDQQQVTGNPRDAMLKKFRGDWVQSSNYGIASMQLLTSVQGSASVSSYSTNMCNVWILDVGHGKITLTMDFNTGTGLEFIYVATENFQEFGPKKIITFTGQNTGVSVVSQAGYIHLRLCSYEYGTPSADHFLSFSWTTECDPGSSLVSDGEAGCRNVCRGGREEAALVYPPPASYTYTNVACSTLQCIEEAKILHVSDSWYGNGNYTIDFSSKFSGDGFPVAVFNGVNDQTYGGAWDSLGYWTDYGYRRTSGNYIPNPEHPVFIVDGYYGEWVTIELPESIVLSHIKIFAVANTWAIHWGLDKRRPRKYRLYGTSDGGLSWTVLIDEQDAQYNSFVHTGHVSGDPSAVGPFNKFALVVNAIAGSIDYGFALQFEELKLYALKDVSGCPVTDPYTCSNSSDLIYYDTSNSSCTQCPARTHVRNPFFCSQCAVGTTTQDLPNNNIDCQSCPTSRQEGATRCLFRPVNSSVQPVIHDPPIPYQEITNFARGYFSWESSLEILDQQIFSFIIQPAHASEVTLTLHYFQTEAEYDFIYIRTSPDMPATWDHVYTGYGTDFVFHSSVGYIEIKITTDNCCTVNNPVSFSWNSTCLEGYSENELTGLCEKPSCPAWQKMYSNGVCEPVRTMEELVICDPGFVVDPADGVTCVPCASGSFSGNGWVALRP